MILTNVDLRVDAKEYDFGTLFKTSSLGAAPVKGLDYKAAGIPRPSSISMIMPYINEMKRDGATLILPEGTYTNLGLGLTRRGVPKIVEKDDTEELYLFLSSSAENDPKSWNNGNGTVYVPEMYEDRISIIKSATAFGDEKIGKTNKVHRWTAFLLEVTDFKTTEVILRIRYAQKYADDFIVISHGQVKQISAADIEDETLVNVCVDSGITDAALMNLAVDMPDRSVPERSKWLPISGKTVPIRSFGVVEKIKPGKDASSATTAKRKTKKKKENKKHNK